MYDLMDKMQLTLPIHIHLYKYVVHMHMDVFLITNNIWSYYSFTLRFFSCLKYYLFCTEKVLLI